MKYLNFILTLLISANSFVFAQEAQLNFKNEINTLNSLSQVILSGESDKVRYQSNDSYKETLKKILTNKTSFNYGFDQLEKISILKAKKLKIYNWALPLTDGTYEYFAFLQIHISKDEFKLIELTDQSSSIKSPKKKTLTHKNWYGALYYELIYDKKIGKNNYTLLGWDGNNKLTNKKIIETISISSNGTVKFGTPILKTKKRTEKRIIFEYSENAVMSLKYHKELKKIVFDYLVPSSSKLTGVYEYYGPALNRFDAFNLNKKKWIYEEDTTIELDRNIKDNFWIDPKEK